MADGYSAPELYIVVKDFLIKITDELREKCRWSCYFPAEALTIFHAHFPHSYLSNITTHSAQYSSLFPHGAKIHLRRSRGYNMRLAGDQAALYSVLARLLWVSCLRGSHVGYLANCTGNPFISKEVCSVLCPLFCVADDSGVRFFDSIVVRSFDEMEDSSEGSAGFEDDLWILVQGTGKMGKRSRWMR